MPAIKQSNIGLWQGWVPGEDGWGDEMNYNLRATDALLQANVIDTLSAPPGSPSAGDLYIVGPGGSGAFSGQDNTVARYDGSAWEFYTPKNGWKVYHAADGNYKRYDGSAWASYDSESAVGGTVPVRTSTGQIVIADPTANGHAVTLNYAESNYEKKRQNNLNATADPGATDDASAGYEVLSRWVNTSTGELWICLDATNGAAVWGKSTLTLDELGSAALVDVGTSAGDVMEVGAFGLGDRSIPLPNNDAYQIEVNGFYRCTSSSANMPSLIAGASKSGAGIIAIGFDANNKQLIFVSRVTNEIFLNRQVNGTWSGWSAVASNKADTADAESGSNDNKWMSAEKTHEAFNQYGLGRPAVYAGVSLDDIVDGGFYYYDTNTGSAPSDSGMVYHVGGLNNDNSSAQIAVDTAGDGTSFFRRKAGGSWSGWNEFYHDGNSVNPLDYGIGVGSLSQYTPTRVSDIDDPTMETGIYCYQTGNTTGNIPNPYGLLEVFSYRNIVGNSITTQVAYSTRIAGAETQQRFFDEGNGGWSDWQLVYTDANLNVNEFGGLSTTDWLMTGFIANGSRAVFLSDRLLGYDPPSSITKTGSFKIVNADTGAEILTGISTDLTLNSLSSNSLLRLDVPNQTGLPTVERVALVPESSSSKITVNF